MIPKLKPLKSKVIGKLEKHKLKLLNLRLLGMLTFIQVVFFLIGNNGCFANSLPTPWKQYNLEEYETGVTSSDLFSGRSYAYIKSKNTEIKHDGNIAQTFGIPTNWLGRRIRITAHLNAINLGTAAAGLFVKTINDSGQYNYDAIKIRHNNDSWEQYSVVLDISVNVISMQFGVWLKGQGEIRVDDFAFQVIDEVVETNNKYLGETHGSVSNLDFEKKSKYNSLQLPWMQTNMKEYETGIISSDSHSGRKSAYIKSKNNHNVTYGCLLQVVPVPSLWLGKRIKLVTYIESINVENDAGLFFRVAYENGGYSKDTMRNRRIRGNTHWTQYTSVLDIPYDSTIVIFGACLEGGGEIRVDDFNFQTVDDDVEITGEYYNRKYGHPQNLGFEILTDLDYHTKLPYKEQKEKRGHE